MFIENVLMSSCNTSRLLFPHWSTSRGAGGGSQGRPPLRTGGQKDNRKLETLAPWHCSDESIYRYTYVRMKQ